MPRQYISKPSQLQKQAIEDAQRAQLFIISSPGVTSFVLRDGAGQKFKVQLGEQHSCTCAQCEEHGYCVHVAFIMTKRFGLQPENPLVHQTGLVDAEIDKLLTCPAIAGKPAARAKSRAPRPAGCHARNEITPEHRCPVCLDGFGDCTPEEQPYCASCGNTVHQQCMYMYLEHNAAGGARPRCPYCRADYVDGRTVAAGGRQEARGSYCSCCQWNAPAKRLVYSKYDASRRFCMFCFLNMDRGTYQINGRQIKVVGARAPHSVPTKRQTIIESLIYRDITGGDYGLLQQLDDPYADSRREVLRMPGYLIPDCFKVNRTELRPCALCLGEDINLFNLISQTLDDGLAIGAQIEVDYESLRAQLKTQNEVVYTSTALQELRESGQQRFLACGVHCCHELCMLCCSVAKPVLYTPRNQQFYQLRVVPDFCAECQIPFLKEWLRRSRLEQRNVDTARPGATGDTVKASKPDRSALAVRRLNNRPEQQTGPDPGLAGCIQITLPQVLRR